MSWALRKQISYLSVFLLIIFFIVGVIIFLILDKEPSCSDGLINQQEKGVDCGGPCEFLCDSQVLDLNILWTRSFKVAPGVYNAMAYIENPNVKAGIEEVRYIFKIFDKEGILIKERVGKTYILPGRKNSIFEPAIRLGNRIPARTDIQLKEDLDWRDVGVQKRIIEVQDVSKEIKQEKTKISATLINNSTEEISDIKVDIVIFGIDGNALNASQTYVEKLEKKGEKQIFFTWQNPIKEEIGEIDIKPSFNFIE